MTKTPQAPPGSWPRLMRAETAAAYLDEASVEAFRRKVGSIYPMPVTGRGSRQKWDRLQLDQAVAMLTARVPTGLDAASVL
jgi:hypothetical protein